MATTTTGELSISQELLRALVNEKVSFVNALRKLNPENYYELRRPVFCPFHHNENTPAAVIYDGDKGETLWCFAEQKLYRPVDLLNKVLHQDAYAIGLQIWNTMDESSKQEFIARHQDFGAASFSVVTKIDPSKLEHINYLFKYGKISYTELMSEYRKHL